MARLAAKAGHLLLYALLIATPILGVVLQFARGKALPVFGLFDIPSPWVMDRAFFRQIIGLHQLAADALVHRRARPRRGGACSTIGRLATARWRACCPGWGKQWRGPPRPRRAEAAAAGSATRSGGERLSRRLGAAAGCARRPMRWQIAKTRSARFIV